MRKYLRNKINWHHLFDVCFVSVFAIGLAMIFFTLLIFYLFHETIVNEGLTTFLSFTIILFVALYIYKKLLKNNIEVPFKTKSYAIMIFIMWLLIILNSATFGLVGTLLLYHDLTKQEKSQQSGVKVTLSDEASAILEKINQEGVNQDSLMNEFIDKLYVSKHKWKNIDILDSKYKISLPNVSLVEENNPVITKDNDTLSYHSFKAPVDVNLDGIIYYYFEYLKYNEEFTEDEGRKLLEKEFREILYNDKINYKLESDSLYNYDDFQVIAFKLMSEETGICMNAQLILHENIMFRLAVISKLNYSETPVKLFFDSFEYRNSPTKND